MATYLLFYCVSRALAGVVAVAAAPVGYGLSRLADAVSGRKEPPEA